MKHAKLLAAVARAEDRAADDVLLEALRLGQPAEQAAVLRVLIERKTPVAHHGVLGQFAALPAACQATVVAHADTLYHALSACGRSPDKPTRLAVIRVIAAGRQGKLGYVLSENLRDTDDELSKAACDALLDMARWVHQESRLMHRLSAADDADLQWVGDAAAKNDSTVTSAPTAGADLASAYNNVMRQRPEIESAVARALDWVRTKHLADLMRAALLLCDHPQSRILAILKTVRHGGQASMARKLQQPPAAEHVAAFLLGASHGHLRGNFAAALAQVTETSALDALLRRTHWLADHQLRACMGQVSRGVWYDEDRIDADLRHRKPRDAARAATWIGVSGLPDVEQDARLARVLAQANADPMARLSVLRVAAARPGRTSVGLLKAMLDDADERFARIAVRELIRRRPPGYEELLLRRMADGAEGVRRVVGRALGHASFARFWDRFDRMAPASRKPAGRAMLKLVPDAAVRIGRYLAGTVDERVRAMQVVAELGMGGQFREPLARLCLHANAKVRSKAAGLLSAGGATDPALLARLLDDADSRVRANAIEVVERKHATEFAPLLAERTRSASGRERANAIKALHGMRVGTAASHLAGMLADPRADHRISALWALRHAGVWSLLKDVGRVAQADDDVRVRRYAVAMLKAVIDQLNQQPPRKAA